MTMKTNVENSPIDPIEVTDEMIDAALAAIEPFALTSADGYDMLKALPAAFRAMSKKREESQSLSR
jgi:hypothetical protein